MRAVYRGATLVTRLGEPHADHAKPDDRPEWWPSSSSRLPSLVVQMARHPRPDEGVDVLDVGTGTGYGAALLSRPGRPACHERGRGPVPDRSSP
ncbi:hypothetical protein ABGB09_24445 [Streptomyces sp. B8F3]|uniref:hypothetical protein n=1 Tax=Streptomyces sp. B8F3 TaxID=3153573 RepID=UPI00325E9C7C